ncbi:hypothetical protein IJG72_04555 [bacterium]|nr:hypothetical protein [bacterium]
MGYSLNRYENMLKDFIVEQQSDAYNKSGINQARYNNLKVTMEPAKVSQPHIFITIGISDACFSISEGILISGSIGADTKYITKWINKPGIKEELMASWADIKDLNYENVNDL